MVVISCCIGFTLITSTIKFLLISMLDQGWRVMAPPQAPIRLLSPQSRIAGAREQIVWLDRLMGTGYLKAWGAKAAFTQTTKKL